MTTGEIDNNKPPLTASFVCPHQNCRRHAQMHFFRNVHSNNPRHNHVTLLGHGIIGSICSLCDQVALWEKNRLLYPVYPDIPAPNEDMPLEVKGLYNEAASISHLSPRAAAALLRLALDILCIELGANEGDTLHKKIGHLVERGLSEKFQQAFDGIRSVGNDAVHPSDVAEEADEKQTKFLFILLNKAVEQLISEPREIDSFYSGLPEGTRVSVRRRDGN